MKQQAGSWIVFAAAITFPIESWQEHGDPMPPPRSEMEYIAPVAVG